MRAKPAIICFLGVFLTGTARGEIDFDTQVVPILSKAGCNAADCHGGAAGRGGFRLSLFGGDPPFDFRSIVRELEGRRINLARPQDSLLLAKPLGRLEHGGGKRLEADSYAADQIAMWIEEGGDRLHLRQLRRLVVRPRAFFAPAAPAEVQLEVQACFDDGTSSDASHLAVYSADDDSAVSITSDGGVVVLRPGRHIVLVRFGALIEPVEVTVPLGSVPVDLADAPRWNWIDDEILATLESLRLPPSEQCDDATFLRRVTLDLTGRLPEPAEVRAFLSRPDESKRTRLVEQLLDSPEFVEFWTYRLATYLRVQPPGGDSAAGDALYQWLRAQVERDAGWDETARALLIAEGDSHHVGPAAFHRLATGPREQAEHVSETLMGVRMRCANCHNHPLDRWTQDDYHGLAQVFARIERGRVVGITERGEVTHPQTGEAAVPRIPGERWLDPERDARAALANWLVDPENPYFTRAMVGRIWRDLMGHGLVEPTNDLRATNPPSHPALLDRLAEDFAEHDYSIRRTIRLICNSAAYSRSSQPTPENAAGDRYYAHAVARPLDAEVLADAIGDVTGIYDRYGDRPVGTRAITLIDPRVGQETLDILGRCDPSQSCESTSAGGRGIAARLHLLNGPLLNRRLVDQEGRLQQMIAAGEPTDVIVEEFYLRALGRQPRREELSYWQKEIDKSPGVTTRQERLEDFVWGLLNCRQFVTNH